MYSQYKQELLLPAIIHVLRTHWATQCTHNQKHLRKWIMTRYRETSISLARFRTIYETRCLDILRKIKHDGKKIEKPWTVKNVRSWPSRVAGCDSTPVRFGFGATLQSPPITILPTNVMTSTSSSYFRSSR